MDTFEEKSDHGKNIKEDLLINTIFNRKTNCEIVRQVLAEPQPIIKLISYSWTFEWHLNTCVWFFFYIVNTFLQTGLIFTFIRRTINF